jgi:hypothetical protein
MIILVWWKPLRFFNDSPQERTRLIGAERGFREKAVKNGLRFFQRLLNDSRRREIS